MSARAACLLVLATAGCADLLGVESLSGVDAGDAAADAADAGADASMDAGDAGCTTSWVKASGGQVPPGAIAAPMGDAAISFVCRVTIGNDLVPGKLLTTWGCYYGDAQGEHLAGDYEVLVPRSCAVAWSPAPGGLPPGSALECGRDSQGALYSCALSPSEAHPGELGHMGWSTSHQCLYSYGGASISSTSFSVLTAK